MKDLITKLKILSMLFRGAFDEWKEQIYQDDLDRPYCCSGYDCGCGGMTIRELYSMEENEA
jgi:hypothetical protein